MKNIAVLVSGGGTNLQALIDSDIKIALVVSSVKNAFAIDRAEKAGIKTITIERKNHTQESFDESLIASLIEHNIDFIILAGFLCILGEKVINKFENKIINVHPSLIPSFSGKGFYGLKVHKAALEKGVKITGATVHYVNNEIDGGKIILQKAVEVLDGDTPERLQERVMKEAEWVILPQAAAMLCKNMEESGDKNI